MKFSEKDNSLYINVRELVTLARIKICPVLPRDEDEPSVRGAARSLRKKLLGAEENVSFSYNFTLSGYNAVLNGSIDALTEDTLSFITQYSPYLKGTKKELLSEARGEAFISAYAFCKTNGCTRVKIKLYLVNETDGSFIEKEEEVSLYRLESFFNKCLGAVAIYARPEIDRVTLRVPSMRAAKFPYTKIRESQDEFIRRAYKNIARGTTLFATAPTGTGKTVSALFPAIRALGDGRRDKIFYFTPKETSAIAAKECLELFSAGGVSIRAVILGAKEKRCINGGVCKKQRNLCKNAACNFLCDATMALYDLNLTVIGSAEIEEVARKYTVCPYELSLAYSQLCDVIICDFNYLFDPSVYIRRFFVEGGNFIFLVDEAHNLPDRAREMYSAEISASYIKSPQDSLLIGEHSALRTAVEITGNEFSDLLYKYVSDEIYKEKDGTKVGAAHLKEIPSQLYDIFDALVDKTERELLASYSAKDNEAGERTSYLRSYLYEIKKFKDTLEAFDSSYELFIFCKNDEICAKLFCIDTGTQIKKRLDKGASTIFFSATLTPLYYYRAMLGGDNVADELELDSPFDPGQLSVNILDKISTRFSEREDTLSAVVRTIAAAVSAKRGNYMVFSPSFLYSDALAKAFISKYPKLHVMVQKKNMSAKEKSDFLAEFKKESESYLVAFCVMGGIYSEGIDLAGDSLIGAIIVGTGLPALSYEREAIAAYYDEKYEEGKAFAYVYPGMNRVLQAAGRVVRREDDRGIIVLIDDRFDDPIYKKIIPKLWNGMQFLNDPKALREELDKFWKE